jgi:hypothetical protein
VGLDGKRLATAEPDNVLETSTLIGQDLAAATGTLDNLEVDQVEVDTRVNG